MPKVRKDFRLAHHPQTETSIVIPQRIVDRLFRQTNVESLDPHACWLYEPTPFNWGGPDWEKNPRRYHSLNWTDEEGVHHAIGLHRLALIHGTDAPAPDLTLDVLHRCANPRCVRFQHLRWGTQKENSEDYWRPERFRRQLRRKIEAGQPIRLSVSRPGPVCVAA